MVALGIIGAIAALSIPSLLNNINNRMLTTQLKSFVGSIQQLLNEQMVIHKTQDARDILLGGEITNSLNVAKECENVASCWTNSGTDVVYKRLDTMLAKCSQGDASACFGAIVDNGWKMPY